MKRSVAVGLVMCAALCAQTKKVLYLTGWFPGEQARVRELQSISPKVRIVPVTRAEVMREMAMRHGFIGEIRPEEAAGRRRT